MPLNWQPIVDELSAVQRLVFQWTKYDGVDEVRLTSELFAARRMAYNDELSIQAANVGCPGLTGNLTNSAILGDLETVSERDAVSIVNTFNYFLALEIIRIYEMNYRANRYYYAARLREWLPTYWSNKEPQIATMTDNSARAKAQQDFYSKKFNGALGSAKLEPRTAVCPICQGWIARGIVPLRVALNNPPPYHPNCPHTWSTRPDKTASEDCPNLWMGE